MSESSLDLVEASSPAREAPGEFRWEVPDGWQQGRGAYGGLVLAALVRATDHELDADDQRLRTLGATLCAPVLAETSTLAVEQLRAGNNTTVFDARVLQNGEVRAESTLFYGSSRSEDANWSTSQPPSPLAGPTPAEPSEADTARPPSEMSPRFTTNFEYRPLTGFPFTGGVREVEGWIRPERPGPGRDCAHIAALIDAYWPAAYVAFQRPRPVATVSFSLQILCDPTRLDPDEPLFYDAESPEAFDGYALESRRLWDRDGRLLAVNQQNFCIIK